METRTIPKRTQRLPIWDECLFSRPHAEECSGEDIVTSIPRFLLRSADPKGPSGLSGSPSADEAAPKPTPDSRTRTLSYGTPLSSYIHVLFYSLRSTFAGMIQLNPNHR